MRKEIAIILLLVIVSFPAVKSLLQPGGYTSHDMTHHVIRQISMDRLLSEGQFPPRWSGELNNGYGYPVFLFNYPLPAIVGELFHKMGLGFVDSVKAVLFASMIFSSLGMYLFLKALLGNRMGAFLGAIFYLYAPIRFIYVYVSASVGSALALGILPFLFWSVVGIKNGKKWAVWMGGLSLAGLILAHNVTALIFAPVVLVFALVIGGIRVIREVGIMVLLGLGLSAWFWLPAAVESQYIRFDEIYKDFYKDQFVNLWQMLRSPWGYGLSHPMKPEVGDMSYQVGLLHIGVILVLAGSLIFRRIRRMREIRWIGGFSIAFFMLSVILMHKISMPFWESLPGLNLVQFPWRFSAVAIFTASIAAALLVKYGRMRWFLFIFLFVLVIYANRNHWNINERFDPAKPEDYYLGLKTTSTTYGEHLPKWGRVIPEPAIEKLEVVNGKDIKKLEIKILREESAEVLAEVKTSAPATLRLNQFYFPGWEVEVDGKKVNFDYLSEGESYGLPVFDIERGRHLVLAKFKNTQIRNLADSITIITVIIIIIFICKQLTRR